MEDVVCNSAAPPKKSSTTLSMDRAAFLLLRVKKAFKRKRQQRKDKQAQAIIAAAHTHQTRAARKVPPPLLRSRTLPAIIVPGLPVVSFHTDKTQLHFDENIAATKSTNRGEPRWSLLTRNTATAAICFSNNNNNNNTNYTNFNNNTLSVKSLNLPKDDVTLAYRRKSSGSTPHSVGITPTSNYYPDGGRTPDTAVAASSHTATTTTTTLVRTPSTLDDLACYGADGSVLLRIPVPEVVAAHAYRMTNKSSRPGGSDSFSNNYIDSNVVSTTPTFEASHHLTTWSDFNTSKFDLLYENKINSSSTSASSSTATISNSNSSNLALTRRFAKLLHQSSGSMGIKSQQQQPTEHIQHPRTVKLDNTDNNFSTLLTASTCYNDEAPRRLSWERRKDSSALQRSASIDSFAEIVWSDSPQPALEIPKSLVAPFSKRPSASSLYSTCSSTAQSIQVNINYISGAGLDLSGGNSGNGTSIASSSGNNRRESLLSPSATRRNKLTRVVNDNVQQLKPSPQTSAPLQAESFLCSNNSNNNKINSNSNKNNNNNNNNNNSTHSHDTDNNYEIVSLCKTHHTCNPSTASIPSHSSIEYTPPILQPQQNQPTNYHHYISPQNTTPSACNNNYTIINRFNDTDQHSNNRDNPTYYVESGVNSINCHISSPVQDNSHENAKIFNLSKQLKQENVITVAKLRNAISCHSQYAKEMEYLLPPQNQQKQQHSHSHNHNHKHNHYHYHHCQRYTRHQQLHQEQTQTHTQQKEQHQHSCHSIDSEKLFNDNKSKTNMLATTSSTSTTTATTQNNNNNKILSSSTSSTRHTTKFNQFYQTAAKYELNGIGVGGASSGAGAGAGAVMGDEENTDSSNISSLAIYRQPANVRHKGGNTPYRSKMSKKQLKLAQAQLDKLTQCNLHLHALFSAVEHGHLDKACTILESTDVNVNSINTDGLSALDIAVLSNNRSMTKMLLQHGALEGSQFSVDSLGTKLNSLLKEAESHIQDLNGFEGTCQSTYTTRSSISSIIIGNTSSSVTGCTGNEIDKQIGVWERRIKGLRRLILGWDQARPPDAPASVIVDVMGDNTVQVQILEPFDGAIGTKFRVQWSTRADFSNVVGERELMDWRNFHGTMGTQYQINGLTQGRRYFIRASCGNVKGWGAYKNSVPASIIPSSWRDLNNREDRFLGRQHLLDNLFTAVRLARPADVSELTLESQGGNQKRMPKKKTTIKQLFSVASKFQKHLRRGIHLASIVYCEDKVLVTSEDFLPVIEIDESYPSSLYNDYHWLMKVACSWEDVKSLRSDMERNLTSANHFRIKLLSAVCQMQSALGFIDLGQLYYKPLKDSHGTIAIACIHNVKNQKSVSILNSRWLPVNKLQKKVVGLLEEYTISEILISSLSDQIKYHQAALKTLGPGLYLGYLKMQCSMDQIQVVVPLKTPNVLPHYKVRDNNHINAEEWLILKRYSNSRDGPLVMDHCNYSPLGISLDLNTDTDSNETTEAQRLFLYDLSNATQKLLHYMDVRPEEAGSHRLYDLEVIEHSKDISFLIICPAVQLSCAVPGQPEMLLQRDDLVPLSVQAFEMIHLLTYQPLIMQKYARLSCILELDTALANQSQREAFASSELQTAKERLAKLQELTNSLNSVWKTVRWLMDAIVFARDKNAPTSSSIKQILEFAQNCTETPERSSQFLQPPMRDVKFHKSGTGRGSWPGPATNATNETTSKHLRPEHSKSEQNLGLGPNPTLTTSSHIKSPAQNTQNTLTTGITSSFLHISNDCTPMDVVLRKSSADSVSSSQYNQQQFYSAIDSSQEINSTTNKVFNIPLSRSDDTISEAVKRNSAMQRKCPSGSTPASSMKTVPGSKSVPHLGMDSSAKQGSSHSLTSEFGMEFNENKKLVSSSNEKIKSASSVSLREGGVSLKTTLSSLPTEMRTAIPITIGERGPSTLRRNLERESSNVEFTAISCPSLSSEQSAATASGIIQVYTAYNTGLASGTSLKLHVTAKTSAREIINLVVKQLNMATALKGSKGPIYSAEMMNNFCLVAVIGARERCLRDDFKPLLLQNPWRKGRLYVRQKHELLAAIEHSSRKSQLT